MPDLEVIDAPLVVLGQVVPHAEFKMPRDALGAFRVGGQMRETRFGRALRVEGVVEAVEKITHLDSAKWRTFALAVVFDAGRQQILLEIQSRSLLLSQPHLDRALL